MNDNELLEIDRVAVIKATLTPEIQERCYISFSGGKDSTVLHHLIDLALPNNKIPRVFINTGIEYNAIVKFVKELASKDERFEIINPRLAIKPTLEKYGYPFKSKEHSHYLGIYQSAGETKTYRRYMGLLPEKTNFLCPKSLKFQFVKDYLIKISDKCCYKLKKETAHKWEAERERLQYLVYESGKAV